MRTRDSRITLRQMRDHAREALDMVRDAANPAFDPEGLALAQARDREIESGAVKSLTHQQFLARTGAAGSATNRIAD